MDVATRSDQAVATIEEGLRLDEKEGAVPDGTGWHWDALGCANGKTWKDTERHGKTIKDKKMERLQENQPFPFHSYSCTHAHKIHTQMYAFLKYCRY